jgi:hypothetical protein
MASVQAENLHGLQCPDRGRKGHDLFPFFGPYPSNRIKFIASIGSDFLYISLKRFPGIRVRVLNLPVQREFLPCSRPSEAVTFGIATDWIRPQHRVRCSLALIESLLKQFHVRTRGFRLTSGHHPWREYYVRGRPQVNECRGIDAASLDCCCGYNN